jgi:hypothetical protein
MNVTILGSRETPEAHTCFLTLKKKFIKINKYCRLPHLLESMVSNQPLKEIAV